MKNKRNAFINIRVYIIRYYHGHFLIWQGVSFPDEMVVLEGPFPGYNTDMIVWRDCQIRHDIEAIMQAREVEQRERLKLYADKLYNNSALITAAFSRRHGPLQDWMRVENSIMSTILIAIEWTFGTIISFFKFVDFAKGQKLMKSPLPKHYTIAVFLANCHCCLYGDRHCEAFNCDPPPIDEYLAQ
jgi:hypothetical protein